MRLLVILLYPSLHLSLTNGEGQSFFGFVADKEFTRIKFDPTISGGDNFGMDDVVYSSVPFEFSPSLGLFAIGGIWGISSLRKRVSVSKITK